MVLHLDFVHSQTRAFHDSCIRTCSLLDTILHDNSQIKLWVVVMGLSEVASSSSLEFVDPILLISLLNWKEEEDGQWRHNTARKGPPLCRRIEEATKKRKSTSITAPNITTTMTTTNLLIKDQPLKTHKWPPMGGQSYKTYTSMKVVNNKRRHEWNT